MWLRTVELEGERREWGREVRAAANWTQLVCPPLPNCLFMITSSGIGCWWTVWICLFVHMLRRAYHGWGEQLLSLQCFTFAFWSDFLDFTLLELCIFSVFSPCSLLNCPTFPSYSLLLPISPPYSYFISNSFFAQFFPFLVLLITNLYLIYCFCYNDRDDNLW